MERKATQNTPWYTEFVSFPTRPRHRSFAVQRAKDLRNSGVGPTVARDNKLQDFLASQPQAGGGTILEEGEDAEMSVGGVKRRGCPCLPRRRK